MARTGRAATTPGDIVNIVKDLEGGDVVTYDNGTGFSGYEAQVEDTETYNTYSGDVTSWVAFLRGPNNSKHVIMATEIKTTRPYQFEDYTVGVAGSASVTFASLKRLEVVG